jgi:hypothetical protein
MLYYFRKCQLYVGLSCFVLSACQTVSVAPIPTKPVAEATMFIIKKGEHSSNAPVKLLTSSAIRFEATFDASAVYETSVKENQADINKLYGMADCRSDHHSNSARFGWRWYNGKLEVHAYTYFNKTRHSKWVGIVDLNKAYTYEIQLQDDKYVFSLNGQQIDLPRHCNGTGEGYQLYPYFGGDETAPHDITIAIKNLN